MPSCAIDPSAPLRIGGVTLAGRVWLSPMAGVTDLPFRKICREQGAPMVVTEMVSAEGLIRKNRRTTDYLATDGTEAPYAVQLFGGDPVAMTRAAAIATESGAAIIDINMGCPVKKVVRHCAGSALMRDPASAAAVVAATVRGTDRPVTVKIRAGWDQSNRNCVEVARACQDAGAAAVAIHPRTRAQGYEGRADWSLIRKLKENLAIPVIGSGDVTGEHAVARMFAETGCDGVIVARGALGNPWIFCVMHGWPAPTGREMLATVVRHLELARAHAHSAESSLTKMRKHLIWYTRGLPGGNRARQALTQVSGTAQAADILAGLFEPLEGPIDRGEFGALTALHGPG